MKFYNLAIQSENKTTKEIFKGEMQMKNFSTWLLLTFMVLFWIFRIVVAVTSELGIEFGGIVPLNTQMEIILLFVVLLCILLIVKRKILGALIYLLSYGIYFGTDLIKNINVMLVGQSDYFSLDIYINTFISLIGVAIPVAILFDLLLDKNRKAHPKDKKTDWFYSNKDYDRKLDERADKNNYRTL